MAEPADLNLDELKRRGRRRLIGAVVLALVAAVVVPMLLESEPRPLGEDVSVRIPPIDDGKFQNKLSEPPRKSLADAEKSVLAPGSRPSAPAESAPQAPAATPPAGDPPPPAAQPPAATKATTPVPAPQPQAKSATSSPPPAAQSRADAAKDGFVVQLAAFSDDKGANALASKLKRAGYPAFTETVATSQKTLWRVRVGPYPSREAAAQSRDRLKAEGHPGIVVAAR